MIKKCIPCLVLFFFLQCISLAPKKSDLSSTFGKITESKVEKKWKYRSIYMGHHDFHLQVKYEYEVNGRKYESQKIGYWNVSYNLRSKAEKALAPYPVGSEVMVYYKKENPDEAYLEVEDDTQEDLDE